MKFCLTQWLSARQSQTVLGTCLVVLAVCLGTPVTWAREGVDVGANSAFTKLVPAETVEQSATQQYAQMLQQAAEKNALAPKDHPQVKRLRAIANKLIPFALEWNPRARNWRWEVNLIGSKQINAFCMPGGKIAFYSGILDQLQLTDDEVAMIMGHEIAHALREHARERMGKSTATNIGANLLGQVLGLGQLGQTVTNYGAQLLTLQFSRENESEADLVGMELAARAGFDPRAGISLWQKMGAASKGAPPQWLSTHPSSTTRIGDIQKNLPKVLPLFEQEKQEKKD
jgi:predicted Zn-dependent protease